VEDFELEPTELTGALISMEFGQGGRIQQLWVAESAIPEGTQEFQFVCPVLEMGEEVTESYFPGTILLGARTDPEDPWILSRNHTANRVSNLDVPPGTMAFEYEFSFLEEISATGKFYEMDEPASQIAWDLRIANQSRRSVEIGELGFPLALNNVYEGFPRTDQGTRDLFHDRAYVHKYIGAGASYIHAQRMNGRPPGLVIFPGEDTKWEFYNHVPSSLNTPFRWEGIPVVYVLSQAAVEREGWPAWFSGHTSMVLEPGDSRTFHMRFAAADRFNPNPVAATLIAAGRPSIGVFPAAVAPIDVPITLNIEGVTPARFTTDIETELETEADEDGGLCVVKAPGLGPLKVTFEDTLGHESDASLLFVPPIETLIERRAEWIVAHQVIKDESAFKHAIVAANTLESSPVLDVETFVTPFGIESGLADALFLAEKNTIYPRRDQIECLEAYLTHFLEKKVVNPSDLSVGSLLPNPHGVAVDSGRAQLYSIVFCLYDAMARIAAGYGATNRNEQAYLDRRDGTWEAMVRQCALEEHNGIPLMSYLYRAANASPERLGKLKEARAQEVLQRRYPLNGESLWNPEVFEEAFWAARDRSDAVGVERYLRYAFAARSLSPCWWWYGSDKRWLETSHPHPGMADKGEMCLGPSTVANSLMFLATLDRDSSRVDQTRLRMAFGGLLGIWALVQEDGSASTGFCPDAASKQFGMNWTTGEVGIGLFHYLRGVSSYVLASRSEGLQTFGCHFEAMEEGAQEHFRLRPWDGVGARIVVRHLGLEISCTNARIREVAFDAGKRNATLSLKNTSDKRSFARVEIKGLWGEKFEVNGKSAQAQNGSLTVQAEIPAHGSHRLQVKVQDNE
jgi:hypothetical protein